MENRESNVKKNGIYRCVIIVLDINNLKEVNDKLGHNYGDELISRAARLMNEYFARVGNCYRTGGDEFCIICPNTTVTTVEKVLEEFLGIVETENAIREIKLSIAVGYSYYDSKLEDDIDKAWKRADDNMYINKKTIKSLKIDKI